MVNFLDGGNLSTREYSSSKLKSLNLLAERQNVKKNEEKSELVGCQACNVTSHLVIYFHSACLLVYVSWLASSSSNFLGLLQL